MPSRWRNGRTGRLSPARAGPIGARRSRKRISPKGRPISRPQRLRARLAYDEFFAHQLTLALARAQSRRARGLATVGDGRLSAPVLAALPYRPTNAQTRAISEIAGDMAAERRMNRLLQGDVGSGKPLWRSSLC